MGRQVGSMPTRPSKKQIDELEETNALAAHIVAQTTGQHGPPATKPADEAERIRQLRSQAASILGKLGASKGGKARARNLTAKKRKEIAVKAAKSRWGKAKDN